MNIEKIKLQKYFNACDKHLQRIEEAYADMQHIILPSVERYKNLNKDEVQDIDQYLYRFAKLQDTMGDKIFKLSRTSIGANINEAQDAQSTNDFISKLSISLKEARESKYWLELLKDLEEIIKLLVSIIKSTKANNAKN